MDRSERLLSLFDSTGFGLEVGPSYNPLLSKSRFNVETVDHADAVTLRKKYRDNDSKIEEVDYVTDGRSLLDFIGRVERYDFIVASHVIEHVTDIVRFLKDCEALLKPDGRLVLAVPDKRYCFDALQPHSTVGQALQAYVEKRQRHPPGVIFDNSAYSCRKGGSAVWMEPSLDDVDLGLSAESAVNSYNQALASETYIDAHAWKFTPTSFRFIVKKLREIGYIKLGELTFYKHAFPQPDMHEFYISLSKNALQNTDNDIEMLLRIEEELREVTMSRWAESLVSPTREKSRNAAEDKSGYGEAQLGTGLAKATGAASKGTLRGMLARLRRLGAAGLRLVKSDQ